MKITDLSLIAHFNRSLFSDSVRFISGLQIEFVWFDWGSLMNVGWDGMGCVARGEPKVLYLWSRAGLLGAFSRAILERTSVVW